MQNNNVAPDSVFYE